MGILVKDIALSLAEEESALQRKAAETLKISPEQIRKFKIIKKSLDARRKNRILFVYALELTLSAAEEKKVIDQPPPGLPEGNGKGRPGLPPHPEKGRKAPGHRRHGSGGSLRRPEAHRKRSASPDSGARKRSPRPG